MQNRQASIEACSFIAWYRHDVPSRARKGMDNGWCHLNNDHHTDHIRSYFGIKPMLEMLECPFLGLIVDNNDPGFRMDELKAVGSALEKKFECEIDPMLRMTYCCY